MLTPGSPAPDFQVHDADGSPVRLASFRGRPVVLFFFPRADTPGCTREACAFRDLAAKFAEAGVAVVGVSADKPSAQKRFADKYGLAMPLLCDPDKAMLTAWGVYRMKKLYGKESLGIVRSTVWCDANGIVRHVWNSVKVDGHAEAVLAKVTAG